MATGIHFFKEDVKFRLAAKSKLEKWIASVFRHYELSPVNVNFIFCSDHYLRKLNKHFLRHDYFTDIITFDNTVEKGKTESDIFISTDRVKLNAKKFRTTFQDELSRVMVHGVLHLAGFSDKSEREKRKMKEAEDSWLSRLKRRS